jgi:hypothetical protein
MGKKTYTELLARDTFLSRFHYLNLVGRVGVETFGSERKLNQAFYASREWKDTRDQVIIRDGGCDLGVPGWEIVDRIHVHHMNPLEVRDFAVLTDESMEKLFGLENLICASTTTHNAIHFGDENNLPSPIIERRPGDTVLWVREW